ncbi:hypothetical protein JG687_00010696 [Phytophthora cactorum]|uniref:HAT C-terminal dimerisation domain-containing protein n=1 Tax=Phytophthora cactorum TaxID=29920 RepID=A0A329SVT7_9STRA|nr:hypothetical protein PC117_g1776 [Phytophthora cactorum]KAG3031184.1 hypothetical protein PC120_g3272 [Phytophthora cactorum]KAG3038687.1 hypothetical protein PC119_g2766 [Phytophthora cactorum]KAG3191113.1 hypothetical protein C6341_g1408 [Phytophthora cactorum]KAG3195130.1 hypothetical protein PC128_g8742 [Phytophthora cactorum]
MSSATSERNYSTFGFVHSKLKSRLSTEKVSKLVYIKTNALQLGLNSAIEMVDAAGDDVEAIETDEDARIVLQRTPSSTKLTKLAKTATRTTSTPMNQMTDAEMR